MSKPPLILIVDDHPSNRKLLRCQLESQSFGVLEACDGAGGLELYLARSPDLVLMDIHMPQLSGIDVLQQMRQVAGAPDVPCVAVTAMASPCDRRNILAAGFDDYLAKPYFIHELLRVVTTALRRTVARSMTGKAGNGIPLAEVMLPNPKETFGLGTSW